MKTARERKGITLVEIADTTTIPAALALAYFSLATALVGESPAKWTMSKRRSILKALTQGMSGVARAIRRGDSGMEAWGQRDLAGIRERRQRHA